MTGTRLGLDWTPICDSIRRTVRQHTDSSFVKVAHYAEWVSEHPEAVCEDLRDIPIKTLRIRLSLAMKREMRWKRYSKSKSGPVYVLPGVRA